MEPLMEQHEDGGSTNGHHVPKTVSQAILDTNSKRRWTRRFDTFTLIAMIGGTLIIALCIGFLSFLWSSDETNNLWRTIIVRGWLTRVVTIASLLIRWAVSIQAAAMTSMVAAALLHAMETPLPHAAAVSMVVFSNTGPYELLTRLPHGFGRWCVTFWAMVILMTCTTTLLQFTSTALLSDIGNGTIIDNQNLNLSYGLPYPASSQSTDYQQVRSFKYPAFAEYSEPVDSSDGVSDTGLSMRAFLPVDPQSARESLISYSGPATILDTRVACMRPQFSDLQINKSSIEIQGSVWTEEKVRRLNTPTGVGGEFEPIPFECRVYFVSENTGWAINVCHVISDDMATGLISDMLPEPQEPYTNTTPGSLHLVINTTGTADDWSDAVLNRPNLTIKSTTTDASEWVTLQTNFSAIAISMTLCSFDQLFQDVNITAKRPHGAPEAAGTWDSAKSRYNTSLVREQMGGTKPILPIARRGIFELERRDTWISPELKYFFDGSSTIAIPPREGRPRTNPLQIYTAAFYDFFFRANDSNNVQMCDGCSMSDLHSNIFQDTIKETNSSARALQSMITGLFSMAYYDYLFQFSVQDPANLATERAVIRPNSFKFFTAVIVVLVVHVLLLLLTTVFFLQYTTDSLVGAAWSAVSRISGSATDEWLAVSSRATDDEVNKAMESMGQKHVLVGWVRVEEQVRLRRRKSANIPEDTELNDIEALQENGSRNQSVASLNGR